MGRINGLDLRTNEFEVRLGHKVPDLSYDVYSPARDRKPLESKSSEWERHYFDWLASLENIWEQGRAAKHVLFICHSFPAACRYFEIAGITRRKSTAFGVFPVHLQEVWKERAHLPACTTPSTRDSRITR